MLYIFFLLYLRVFQMLYAIDRNANDIAQKLIRIE